MSLHPLLIFGSVFSIIIAFFVVYRPLFLNRFEAYFEKTSPRDLDYQESLGILEMLNDLQSDFRLGKLSQEDYETLSLEYQHLYLEKKQGEVKSG